jgi:hypothetical protein
MTDWATISSLATAGATLLLALGTFASVRSANRAARAAERTLLAGLRPVLAPSRLEDPSDKITWVDNHWSKLGGGRASVELVDDRIYLAMSLRNVGAGIAVLQGWHPTPDYRPGQPHTELDQFRRQTRDLYIPAGGIGFWQGAVRDADDVFHADLVAAIGERRRFAIELLYSDHEGGQRTISLFSVTPRDARDDPDQWLCSVAPALEPRPARPALSGGQVPSRQARGFTLRDDRIRSHPTPTVASLRSRGMRLTSASSGARSKPPRRPPRWDSPTPGRCGC